MAIRWIDRRGRGYAVHQFWWRWRYLAPGPLSDEGGFNVTGGANPGVVSFIHIENIAPVMMGGGPVAVVGTNGDDDLTVIARDASYNPLADGVQDFTVSVNAGPDVLFINAPTLSVDGLSGDDEFSVTTPAAKPSRVEYAANVDRRRRPPPVARTWIRSSLILQGQRRPTSSSHRRRKIRAR